MYVRKEGRVRAATSIAMLAWQAGRYGQAGHDVINIGTGRGVTVKEMFKVFEIACGHSITTSTVARRAGDLPSFYANSERAQSRLGWAAKLSLADMCRDTWAWQSQNPDGYKTNEC